MVWSMRLDENLTKRESAETKRICPNFNSISLILLSASSSSSFHFDKHNVNFINENLG